jgi:NADPH-dependent 2,4-dienoyl-CoA reductase/sulfur reductase-like enzyme
MSAYFEDYYREKGVTILPQEEVTAFRGNGRVGEVELKSGRRLTADMVVCGIGVVPNSTLFSGNKLEMEKGRIVVNRFLETNLPDVYAAGDITHYQDVIFDRHLHVEHWDNAVEQGRHAARVMMGVREPYEHVPYFFSDVFDLSYEFWGDTTNAEKTVVRGDLANGRFSTWWLGEDGRLLAAFVMNRPDEERENAPEWIRNGRKIPADWMKV